MKKGLACRLNFNPKILRVRCRSELIPFYAKFGWEIIDSPTTVDQLSSKVVFPMLTMILEYGKKPWPKETIDLCGFPWYYEQIKRKSCNLRQQRNLSKFQKKKPSNLWT